MLGRKNMWENTDWHDVKLGVFWGLVFALVLVAAVVLLHG